MNEMLIELGKRAKAAENSLRTISTDKTRSFLLLQIIWLNAQTRFLPPMQKT